MREYQFDSVVDTTGVLAGSAPTYAEAKEYLTIEQQEILHRESCQWTQEQLSRCLRELSQKGLLIEEGS
jgi:hypothetical protein